MYECYFCVWVQVEIRKKQNVSKTLGKARHQFSVGLWISTISGGTGEPKLKQD